MCFRRRPFGYGERAPSMRRLSRKLVAHSLEVPSRLFSVSSLKGAQKASPDRLPASGCSKVGLRSNQRLV